MLAYESILAQKKALSVGKDLSIPVVSLVIYRRFLCFVLLK